MIVESWQKRNTRACLPGKLAALILVVSGCSGIDPGLEFTPDNQLTRQIIGQDHDRFPEVDPLAINDEIRELLEQRVAIATNDRQRLGLLQDLLFGKQFLDLRYSDDRTQTAIEVFESGIGNCLSVMNLYVAAARFLEIDANFQGVKVRPTWDRKGNLIVVSEHINATGKLSPFEDYVVDFTPDLALQQLTAETLSDRQARAMYFNNLGVEALVAEDHETALAFLQNALWLQPDSGLIWNNIGTAHNRSGNPSLAEYSYRMSIHYDSDNAPAIGNLARWYEARGDNGEAARLRAIIKASNRANPYYQFELGNFAFMDGDFDAAIDYYQRAIRFNEYEPVFYVALANLYELRGDERLRRRMMSDAEQLLTENKSLYIPSDRKLRIIDSQSILHDGNATMRIAID